MIILIVSFFFALAVFLLFEVFGINDLIEDFFLSFIDRLRNRGGKK